MTLKTMVAKFAGTCRRCQQAFAAGTQITWTKLDGAKHLDVTQCAMAATRAVADALTRPIGPTLNLSPIVAFLEAARGRGLQFPKARFLAPDGRSELVLSLSGRASKVPGSLQVVIGDDWQGRVEPNGHVSGAKLLGDQALQELLLTIAGNPVEAAKAYGALMCRCSFCRLPLTDAGSVEVGYGPTCAKKWGLPHRPQGTPTVQAVA